MTKSELTKAVEAHEQDTLTDEPLPDQTETERTVYIVIANYDDDPHPHVEGVFSERGPAEELLKKCGSVTEPPHPIAWDMIEQEISDNVGDN